MGADTLPKVHGRRNPQLAVEQTQSFYSPLSPGTYKRGTYCKQNSYNVASGAREQTVIFATFDPHLDPAVAHRGSPPSDFRSAAPTITVTRPFKRPAVRNSKNPDKRVDNAPWCAQGPTGTSAAKGTVGRVLQTNKGKTARLEIDITNHQPVVALRYRKVFKSRRVGGDVNPLPTKRCPLSDLHNFTPRSSLSSSSWPTTTTRTIPASLIPLRSSKMSTNSQTSHQWLTCSRLGSRYPWGTLGRNHPTN